VTLWQFLGPGRYDYRGRHRGWVIFASNLTWITIWIAIRCLYRWGTS